MHKKLAVCLLITQGDGTNIKILAVSRKNDSTAFGLPGGKVDKDESLIAAAKRELLEETGLEAQTLEQVFRHDEEEFSTTTFKVRSYKGIPSDHEGEGIVRWVKPSVLVAGPFGQYNKKLFEIVNIQI